MFKNLKIGVKLGLGFGLVLVLLLAVLLMGVSRMSFINDKVGEITNINNSEVRRVVEMRSAVRNISVAVRNIVLLTDMGEMQKEKDRVDAQRAKYSDAYAKLEKIFSDFQGTSSEEKQFLVKLKEDQQATKPLVDKAIAFGLENKAVEGTAVLLKEVRPSQQKWLKDLDDLADLEYKLTDQATEESNKAYSDARFMMLILGGVAVAFGFLAAFLVTRSITKPLNEALNVANALAEGDMTARIEVNSQDETGQLLQAMKNMVGKLSGIIGEVRGAADALSSASEEVSATAQSMSQATSEQAASVEETSASVEQMSASINQNTENAKVTDGMASQAA